MGGVAAVVVVVMSAVDDWWWEVLNGALTYANEVDLVSIAETNRSLEVNSFNQ